MCHEALPLSEFAPKMSRCRPCDAGYSRQRRAQAGKRKEVATAQVESAYFTTFLASCAVGGGCGNAPPVIRSSIPVDVTMMGA
jgi:hypothetical protein